MHWLVAAVAVMFGAGAVLGAPWLPTRRRETDAALDLLELEPGQTVVDLGSGTGVFLAKAAERGIYGIGYEINPLLYVWSLARTWRCRDYVKLHLKSYWRRPLPRTDGVYVFLVGRYMPKLGDKLERELSPGTSVASYAFAIPGREPVAEKQGIYLYRY